MKIIKADYVPDTTGKAKTKFVQTFKSESVPFLDSDKVYFFPNPKASKKRQPEFILTSKEFKTGIFYEYPESPYLGFGDIQGTNDLILTIAKDEALTVLILPDMKPFVSSVIESYLAGEYDEVLDSMNDAD